MTTNTNARPAVRHASQTGRRYESPQGAVAEVLVSGSVPGSHSVEVTEWRFAGPSGRHTLDVNVHLDGEDDPWVYVLISGQVSLRLNEDVTVYVSREQAAALAASLRDALDEA